MDNKHVEERSLGGCTESKCRKIIKHDEVVFFHRKESTVIIYQWNNPRVNLSQKEGEGEQKMSLKNEVGFFHT